jgi:hypothetical protein
VGEQGVWAVVVMERKEPERTSNPSAFGWVKKFVNKGSLNDYWGDRIG